MIKREAQAFFSAVQFLTRLPTPAWTGWEAGRLDRATPYFTLVGAVIGLICGIVYMLASLLFAPTLAAFITIGTGILLTGGLHEDGLADFADGVGGGRNPERVLAIMKDSRIGAYGVLALILALGMKVTALAVHAPLYGALVLIAAHTISRAYLFATVKALNYARDEKDAKVPPISRILLRGDIVRVVLFAFIALVPMLALAAVERPERLIGAAVALLLAILAMLWVLRLMKTRVGGWTGDTLGAQQQAIETAFLVGASAWTSI